MEFSSNFYLPTDPVSIAPLAEYDEGSARVALESLLEPLGGLDFIEAGRTVIIKANLVSAMKPEESATTHPVLLAALCDMLKERGANVIIGDSPGGLYNAAFVGRVYRVSGMTSLTSHGARLNDDYGEAVAAFEEARVLKTFTYTAYLDKADYIINFCKLKSHGMMNMSAAAKNMFGTIPGIIKPEYHYRFPNHSDFANMIVDLNEYFKPTLSICDAVIGMEGNGPTAGTPKRIGCLLASHSPHNLDMIAAAILGFSPEEIPTLVAARERGLVYEKVASVPTFSDHTAFILTDFERVVAPHSLQFSGDGRNPFKRLFGKLAGAILRTKPVVKPKVCVGCGVCRNICPAGAIVIDKGKAKIDRSKCIRCFCCQEFCPKSAIKVDRTLIAKLFHREKKKPREADRDKE
ncbi:MAG: DUF362 domain-containing protein [Clostridia bacterium]|nr:DUF362 domain-containing protein [Clostridia bacterium]